MDLPVGGAALFVFLAIPIRTSPPLLPFVCGIVLWSFSFCFFSYFQKLNLFTKLFFLVFFFEERKGGIYWLISRRVMMSTTFLLFKCLKRICKYLFWFYFHIINFKLNTTCMCVCVCVLFLAFNSFSFLHFKLVHKNR